MGNLKMEVEPLSLYVLKDEFANRYIKHKNAKYTLTTDSVFEAKLYRDPGDAEDDLEKPYTIKKVYFNLPGNLFGQDVTLFECNLEEYNE